MKIWATLDPFAEDGPILGRRVANSGFLKALLTANPYDTYHFFLANDSAAKELKAWIYDRFPALVRHGAVITGNYLDLPARLASTSYHCMHLSDVLTSYTRLTQTRNVRSPGIFPVTGVTHSLSYTHFMPEYRNHIWPGVSSRDAIIVTSESVRLVMEKIFENIRHSYGLDETAFPSPALKTIPLGVAVEEFPAPAQRWDRGGENNPGLAMRKALSLENEVVFLYFGRLCPSSKMDLMPLFAALRRARDLGLPKHSYALVMAGWADEGDTLPEALCSYARSMGIRALTLLRPTEEQRLGLYAAADVFVSPSDNLQESFGLSVAEAAVSGLPAVVSDFDGYRDIVVHGESGLLVPTLGFCHSDNVELNALWWYDNQYHLNLAQECAVDVPALAAALAALGKDPAMRLRMGEAARQRALQHFSWDAVMARYVELWDSLAAKQLLPGEENRLRNTIHPQRMRFADFFRGHFTRVLDQESLRNMRIRRTPSGHAVCNGQIPMLPYTGLEYMLKEEAVRRLLLFTRNTMNACDAVEQLRLYFEEQAPPLMPRVREYALECAETTLLWCLKQDHIEIVPDKTENQDLLTK